MFRDGKLKLEYHPWPTFLFFFSLQWAFVLVAIVLLYPIWIQGLDLAYATMEACCLGVIITSGIIRKIERSKVPDHPMFKSSMFKI